MNPYELCMTALRNRKLAFVEKFFPTYLCSIGAHLVNVENKSRYVFFEHKIPADLRVHMFMVAPPGFMKSYILFQMLDPNFGILADCQEEGFGTDPKKCGVGIGFEGAMTEAAWTGTVTSSAEGGAETTYGAAYEHRNNIVGIEEFSVIADTLKQAHSSTLGNQLLTSLDKGFLKKRLGRGKVFYNTQVTLWTGSQPARFDLSAGLPRRFYFIEFIPTKEEKSIIRNMRRMGQNVNPDTYEKIAIRDSFIGLCRKLRSIKHIVFDHSIHTFFDEFKMLHFEEPLYERIALGYTVMHDDFNETVEVKLTGELKSLIIQGMQWRRSIKLDSEINQVITLLKDDGGKMTVPDCLLALADFGVDYIRGVDIIDRAVRSRRIVKTGDLLSLKWYTGVKKDAKELGRPEGKGTDTKSRETAWPQNA